MKRIVLLGIFASVSLWFCMGFAQPNARTQYRFADIRKMDGSVITVMVADVRYESCDTIIVTGVDGFVYCTSSVNILLRNH